MQSTGGRDSRRNPHAAHYLWTRASNGRIPLVVCIAGPTATGKTDAAVALSKALGGEVVSMDSMQIYRGMDIGTATPTEAEMGGIPHHLLSFVDPAAPYTVAEYQLDALDAIEDILLRQKLPVFCGGTGLYLQAVTHPLSFGGAGFEPEVREALEKEAEAPEGPHRLLARLAVVDPDSAKRIHQNNTRRIIRALEVYELTGTPLSSLQNDWEAEPEQDFMVFALRWPRETLVRRIESRVDRMLEMGLIDEVRSLLERGVPRKAQAMQAIGYKEIVRMLDGACTRKEAVEQVKAHSRQYAKRQITWLKRDPSVRWIDLSDFADQAAVHAEIIRQIKAYEEERHA